eukprot:TRINITY_DN1479_c0_g1_i1.p1 TRINITY_DN1479_c0_g1~~TRINITY_DN1479_c0_g1_i1.p1  ORF type:complete len:375 (+),score=48.56 TRINITY_DN1479_c0_g1_i1:414-1538(+)
MGAYLENAQHLRILRGKHDLDTYMVLILFNSTPNAALFHQEFHGKPFSSMSAEVCEIDFVEKVTFKGDKDVTLWPPCQKDLASCSICLERLEYSTGGLVTVLCNHSFHCSCLCQCRTENRCPMCRFTQTPSEEHSLCSVCGIEEGLWMCLVCGHVGCSRYKNKHSYEHFLETKHTYSLELDSQNVWDYTKDEFIHRLALNTDGKIVEIPNYVQQQEMGSIVKRDDLTLGKDEALALEWQYLASAQIETQRSYFEEQLRNLKIQNKAKIRHLEDDFNHLLQEKTNVSKQMDQLHNQKKALLKKTESLQKNLTEISKETLFLRTINEALEKNRESWARKMQESEDRSPVSAQDLKIQQLEEQIANVMKMIENSQGQ